MAVTHPTTSVRDGMVNNITAQLNSGTIEIQTAAAAALATMNFQATAYGTPVNGTASANGTPLEDTSALAGTASQAQQKSSGGTIIVQCSVTATGGGGDIELSSVVFDAGDTVRLTSLTYSAPP